MMRNASLMLYDAWIRNPEFLTQDERDLNLLFLLFSMDDVILGKGSMLGKGVFANREFKKGEVVIPYNIKPLTEEAYQQLSEMEKHFVHTHRGRFYLYSSPER